MLAAGTIMTVDNETDQVDVDLVPAENDIGANSIDRSIARVASLHLDREEPGKVENESLGRVTEHRFPHQ